MTHPTRLASTRDPVRSSVANQTPTNRLVSADERVNVVSLPEPGSFDEPSNGSVRLVAMETPLDELQSAAKQSLAADALDKKTDEASDAAVPVTLNQVIFASLNGHPVISAELENIQKARADFLTATLFPNPLLFTDIQLVPLTRPFTVTRQGGPPQQDAVLTYPIDWFLFGKRTAAMSSNHIGVHVGQSQYENLVRIRIVEAASAFYSAIEAKSLLELAKQNVKNISRVEKVTKDAVAIEGRPAIDASRVRLDVIAAQLRQRTAEAAFRTSSAKLRAIMGQFDNSIELEPTGNLTVTSSSNIVPVDAAFEIAQQERPDIQGLRWALSKSTAEFVVQQRAAKPSVAPSFGYTRQYQQEAIGFPDANSWSAALNMGLPISDRNQGNIIKAAAEQRRAQFAIDAALLNLRADVEQAVAELQAAEQNAKSVENEQIVLAEKIRDTIIDAYQNGGRPLLDVLDAQRNYREIYGLFISSRAEYRRALYRYQGAIGRSVGVP